MSINVTQYLIVFGWIFVKVLQHSKNVFEILPVKNNNNQKVEKGFIYLNKNVFIIYN